MQMRNYVNAILRTALLAVALVLSAAPVSAGVSASACEVIIEYIMDLRRLAEQGDPISQHSLGKKYEDGTCVPQDYTEAEKWYRKAAEYGRP